MRIGSVSCDPVALWMNALLLLLLVQVSLWQAPFPRFAAVDAFAVAPLSYSSRSKSSSRTSTQLFAGAERRRDILSWVMKRAAVVGLGFKTSDALGQQQPQRPDAALAAEEDAAVNGRIVTFTVSNIGGDASQSGTVRIQMAPTWAPRGVARFEVRINGARGNPNTIHSFTRSLTNFRTILL